MLNIVFFSGFIGLSETVLFQKLSNFETGIFET